MQPKRLGEKVLDGLLPKAYGLLLTESHPKGCPSTLRATLEPGGWPRLDCHCQASPRLQPSGPKRSRVGQACPLSQRGPVQDTGRSHEEEGKLNQQEEGSQPGRNPTRKECGSVSLPHASAPGPSVPACTSRAQPLTGFTALRSLSSQRQACPRHSLLYFLSTSGGGCLNQGQGNP